MTYFFTTLVLFLISLATGIFAFGGFHEPAPSVAFVLFIAFTALLVMSATFELSDYREHHPRHR
jgi:uncharacterized membrane protein YtjA (UPF0391 family)